MAEQNKVMSEKMFNLISSQIDYLETISADKITPDQRTWMKEVFKILEAYNAFGDGYDFTNIDDDDLEEEVSSILRN